MRLRQTKRAMARRGIATRMTSMTRRARARMRTRMRTRMRKTSRKKVKWRRRSATQRDRRGCSKGAMKLLTSGRREESCRACERRNWRRKSTGVPNKPSLKELKHQSQSKQNHTVGSQLDPGQTPRTKLCQVKMKQAYRGEAEIW